MRISLFWRTFLLVGGLIVLSIGGSLQMQHSFDRAPPEQQIAWEIASIVNLTRSALVSSEIGRRQLLLDELARDEDVRVLPLEPGDRVEPLPNPQDTQELERRLHSLLGPDTRIAGSVNDDKGLWVSFLIDEDAYWLSMNLDRWTRRHGVPWWQVASLAVLVSMLGALAISRLVNRPLATLARAIGNVSAGLPAAPLPEEGPTEIAAVNRRFNRMASDLAALESDRALALAGISHDIRTPLTRLRMEIELSAMAPADKESASADIERIDEIVGKFVEYARSGTERTYQRVADVDVALGMGAVIDGLRSRSDAAGHTIDDLTASGVGWHGDPLDLARIVANLVENALRYSGVGGRAAHVTVGAIREHGGLRIEVADDGPGVPESQLERLLRPFARLDSERSEHGGSGLGLAIVQRLARRYGGDCKLRNRVGGGLIVTVTLPDAPR